MTVQFLRLGGAVKDALAVPLGVRRPEEREIGHQIIVWSDGLGGGLAADIVATAVNESRAGQVTVTGVVKDLALGSRLDLTAGPVVRLPSGGQMPLFLALPLGARGLAGPRHDA